MHIREQHPTDDAVVVDLVTRAFAGQPFADGDEQKIIPRLRRDGDLSLALVAEDAGRLVGQIAVSPAELGDNHHWAAIGPIAVEPERRKTGIGSALMREALARLPARGFAGVVLVGDPAFYGRLGFESLPGLTCKDVPDQFVLGLALGDIRPQGAIRFADGFGLND